MKIILLGKTDASKLSVFFKGLDNQSKNQFHPHPYNKKFLNNLLGSNRDIRLGIVEEGKIIGYAFVSGVPFLSIGYFGVGIASNYQGKGLGEKLTKAIIKFSKGKFNKIYLNVYTENSGAIRLYDKIGFKRIDVNILIKYLILFSELLKYRQFFSAFRLKRKKGKVHNTSIWMRTGP